ncbi:hypothetical protein CWI36_1229p0020 [Hamiltosporidium magnivora]|uniref:Uncharacterized protein n=1 Tax=Hamiltosporidium magnivora TaxID=148818 RepID=A0A4Q9L5Q4_9MICR|nr:hypothetical protein CWI36_1229p0020 [Hamiltosporidium magnivora]
MFIDKMLLGKNVPEYAEEAVYPSTTFRRLRCTKKHCSDVCVYNKDMRSKNNEWEFWAFLLSEKKMDGCYVLKQIGEINDELRFSVWIKLSGARYIKSEFDFSYIIGTGNDTVSREAKKCSAQKNTDSILKIDQMAVKNILASNKISKNDNEREVFCIYKNISKYIEITDNNDLNYLLRFIAYIFDHSHSTQNNSFYFIYILLEKYNMKYIFLPAKYTFDELKKNIKKDYDFIYENGLNFIREFVLKCISENKNIFDKILDLSVCLKENGLFEIIQWIIDQSGISLKEIKTNETKNDNKEIQKSSSESTNVKNIKIDSKITEKKDSSKENNDKSNVKTQDTNENTTKKNNLETNNQKQNISDIIKQNVKELIEFITKDLFTLFQKLQTHLISIKEINDNFEIISPKDTKEETYFDFLVIQEQCLKAQEAMKTEMEDKIINLTTENKSLNNKNTNLTERINNMEHEISYYQNNIVTDIKKRLQESRKKIDDLEEENLNLKAELVKVKKQSS